MPPGEILNKGICEVIGVSKEAIDVARSSILCRKVLPGGTTLAANERRAIKKRRSHFVATDMDSQEVLASLICAS